MRRTVFAVALLALVAGWSWPQMMSGGVSQVGMPTVATPTVANLGLLTGGMTRAQVYEVIGRSGTVVSSYQGSNEHFGGWTVDLDAWYAWNVPREWREQGAEYIFAVFWSNDAVLPSGGQGNEIDSLGHMWAADAKMQPIAWVVLPWYPRQLPVPSGPAGGSP